ncbi:hypothetical protein APZ41_005280 [Roseomonas mucosa]|uniref:Uncharacterized protein n=1 Tax=Roseomonas mucosa TaxID=207340 RepID=A0A1S8D8W1_9PROT|nr:hypothetical protein [Roseomonas mucosa]ONH84227.1 hypothetical protein APZ41_005280 [Roseomonas mucosa]
MLREQADLDAFGLDCDYGDDVVDLATASAIDAFALALGYAQRMMPEHRAVAVATLKDAAADLEAHGLHVMAGRFMGRDYPGPPSQTGGPTLHRSLVLRIRRETEDPAFTVDRGAEPLSLSDEEDWFVDDGAANDAWLAWEGKNRLALWPDDTGESSAARPGSAWCERRKPGGSRPPQAKQESLQYTGTLRARFVVKFRAIRSDNAS